MKFNDALKSLQDGHFVKRAGWEDGYCCLMPDMGYIWRILTVPNANAGNYLPLLADILADDWQTYKGKHDVVKPECEEAKECEGIAVGEPNPSA